MEWLIKTAAWSVRAGEKALVWKWRFLGVFFLVFVFSTLALARLDLLPSAPADPAAEIGPLDTSTPVVTELPLAISIPTIGLSVAIDNPTTTDTGILDNALLRGAVRYPTSAKLGEQGNVVLFGHSSYLPIVGNQAYRTFNGIQKLHAGDVIMVSSSGLAYEYRVRSVSKESANDAVIPLTVDGKVLTLATCDSFALKTDRFVVVADFVGRHSLSTS